MEMRIARRGLAGAARPKPTPEHIKARLAVLLKFIKPRKAVRLTKGVKRMSIQIILQ